MAALVESELQAREQARVRGLCRRLRELRLGACAWLDDRVACALNIRSGRSRARGGRGGGGGAAAAEAGDAVDAE